MSKPDQDDHSARAKPDQESERVRIKSVGGKEILDLLIFSSLALAAISGGFLSVFSYLGYWQNKETWAIWSFYCLIVFTITAGFLTWQKRIWERPKAVVAVERPELSLEGATVNFAVDEPPEIRLAIRNRGSLTACNICFEAQDFLKPPSFSQRLEYAAPEKWLDVYSILAPDAPMTAFTMGGPPVSEKDIRDVVDHRVLFFHYAQARYEDKQGNVYFFDCCLMYHQGPAFRIAPLEYWPKDEEDG